MRMFAVLMLSLLVSAVAFAGDDSHACGPECTGDCCASEFSGFVEGGFLGQIDHSSTDFSAEQVEVDFVRKMSDRVIVRADVEYMNVGGVWTANIEQAYVSWACRLAPSVHLKFGKFNAPFGYEAVDAPDMLTATHGLLFVNAAPTNLTGLMAKYKFTKNVYLKAYVANGWDLDTDNNEAKTYGGRLGYWSKRLQVGLSGIGGSFDVDQNFNRMVYDVDVSYMMNPKTTFGAEFNMGTISSSIDGVDDVTWTGFMVLANYEFTKMFGATLRYDSISDADGALFGMIPGTTDGTTRSSLTVAPMVSFGHGMHTIVEYRMDMVDDEDAGVFTDADGKLAASNSQIMVEMVYTF